MIKHGIKSYESNSMIWKIQVDTYQRELERYGHNTIDLCESIFFLDSAIAIEMINLLKGDKNDTLRWMTGIKAIDAYLNLFGFSLEEKIAFSKVNCENFEREFKTDKAMRDKINRKYSHYKVLINETMEEKGTGKTNTLLLKMLHQKSNVMKLFADEIIKIKDKDALEMNYDHLIGSLIHMMLNRLISNKERMHEFILYDFINKYYHSVFAKNKILQDNSAN